MIKESLKSYGKRTDKSMKTIVKLERLRLKIHNNTVNYLSEYNLTFNQFKVLEVLYHRGDLNTSSITKLTMSTPGNITVVIKNLKRDGLITSIKLPQDRRNSILTLTEEGKLLIEKVFPDHAKKLYNSLSVLNEQELGTLYNLLDKVYQAN
ncbi:MarR family transcriptional regulator [Halarcobacter mediterraneus]|uniref:MarR family transcriptional regulator n=1 Tax=Halarcobacter mediterraneus TaxID=2023153 RepID=A0A4Q1AYC6_9BACT|nr:MarR family transcriptional regulator [Halarcobacter mediterraneus]RXK12630.1 MarR family transcriptional regulator [Halarcobacter mediterraneus]|eukprot:gnl/Chilomastix_cuspidata/8905.p1 GENE.gnl/Chilomastix_cuspidata/8905~~gnl/Chilomastix_cuspidata/8905.p1  ORF type:complete len:151 (-),score=2.97 gnl/Chilomastix_cuspidata/8905:86-538(-)